MADAQNLPANLRFFMSRLQGVSTSHYKIFPTAGDTGTANKIIRFELPSNVLINLKSARLMFNAAATASGGGLGRLPEDTRSLIERVTIYAGGVQIQNGHNAYNVLCHAKKALTGMQPASALTHPEFCRQISYHDPTISIAVNEDYSASVDDQLAIDSFDGFFGTAAPSIIDTGIFPQITVEFTLADNNVCSVISGQTLSGTNNGASPPVLGTNVDIAGAGSVTYSLTNMTMQVEVLGMASSILDEIVAERISQVGYLSIPFKNYYTFTSQHGGTTRFNVNSSSFDRLWCCWRKNDFGSSKAPVVVQGYKTYGAYVSAAPGTVTAQTAGTSGGGGTATVAAQAAIAITQDMGKPQYDIGGMMGTNCEKYQTKYFQFQQVGAAGGGNISYQLQINGANYPAYRLNTPESLAMSLNSVDYFVNSNRPMTLDQFKKNYCVQAYRFCLPESDAYRLASGLDTRATSAQCAVLTEGLHASDQHLTIFAECQAELRVASRQVELIP